MSVEALRQNGEMPQIDTESVRVSEFQELLGQLSVKPLTTELDMSDADPTQRARTEFIGRDYQARPTLYVAANIAGEVGSSIQGFKPYISRSGKASAHGVFFGALVLNDGFDLPVAVKPHEVTEDTGLSRRESETSCLRDYFTNVAAEKCGLKSLEPVGFMLSEGEQPYSLTVLDEKLTSFDSINWTRYYEEGYETVGMRELYYKAALHAANLHDTGYSYHGDLAPRNIATNLYGQVFFIDWEKGNVTQSEAPDVEERFGKSLVDLKALMMASVKPPFGSDPGIGMFMQCQGNYWEEFKDVFFDDYAETRLVLASRGSHHMRRLRNTHEELKHLEATLRMEMDKWQHNLQPEDFQQAA